MAAFSEASSSSAATQSQGSLSADKSVVTWEAANKVHFIAYPGGNPHYSPTGPRIADIKDVAERMKTVASLCLDNYSGFAVVENYPTVAKNATPSLHQVLDPQLQRAVLSFSRYPEKDDISDLSTPYNTTQTRSLLHRMNLPFSIMALPSAAQKVLHSQMLCYFDSLKERSDHMEHWNQCTLDFFKRYDYRESDNAYELFSQLGCSIAGKFLLGIHDPDFGHYAWIWNTLFAPKPQESTDKNFFEKASSFFEGVSQKMKQGVAKFYSYDQGLYPLVAAHVKRMCRHSSEALLPGDDFLSYCHKHKVAAQVVDALDEDYKARAVPFAKKYGLSLMQMVLVDAAITLIIGMQENFAFTLAECCRRLKGATLEQERLRHNPERLSAFVDEVLRWIPPEGHIRQLRWDTTVTYKGSGQHEGKTLTHHMKAGDLIGLDPSSISRNESVYPHAGIFDTTRPDKTKHCPFGAGPHRCPGEPIARLWIRETLKTIVDHFDIGSPDGDEQVYQRFIVAFTMKHEPPVKLALKEGKKKGINPAWEHQVPQ